MATNNQESVALAAIKAAGWPSSEWGTALAVAKAESGLNPRAVNNKNKNGTSDYGLFQINSIHKPTAQEKVDPYANAKRAYQIWKDAGGKWTPWSAYNNGSYKNNVSSSLLTGVTGTPGTAGEALGSSAGEAVGTAAIDVAKATVESVMEKVTEFLQVFYMVLIGLILIIIGIVILSRGKITDLAVGAVTKGVLGKKGVAGQVIKAVSK